MPTTGFNPPPGWPVPAGWTPPADWLPDPAWPPAPPGWQFWVDQPAREPQHMFTAVEPIPEIQPTRAANPGQRTGLLVGIAAVVVVVAMFVTGAVLWWAKSGDRTGNSAAGGTAGTTGTAGAQPVSKCGRPAQFRPETIRAESSALVIRTKILPSCVGGDVLSAPQTRITVTSGGQNVAAGMFDLSGTPIVIAPGTGGDFSAPFIEHELRFPLGTFWRLPISGDDASTLVIDYQETGAAATTVRPGSASAAAGSASTAIGPAAPASGDDESASADALRTTADADRSVVTRRLADRWVPQLSSKRIGLVADGVTWNNAETLREHQQLRLDYPDARLLWSGDWSTFSEPDFWITIAGATFSDPDGALRWCLDHNRDRDHCYAKLVSTRHPIDGSTAFNP